MRVPLSWLHEFVDPGLSPEELAELLTMGGLEVEAIHRPSAGTRGVRVAEVRSVERIPGSDKLSFVTAFDGEQTHEIVCGASNFAPGDKVAAALPGATLPGGVRIGRKELFGRVSDGMLASARELGVGDDHRGIWVLDAEAPVGADLSEWLGLDDVVLELEVTPDRGYALSIIGVARDVAALSGAPLRLPETAATAGPAGGQPEPGAVIRIEDPRRCARFDARTIRGVRLGPSPAWVQRRLAAAGMRPISNVVDATNHTLLETGHPVHAYDLDRVAGGLLEARDARPGERLVTLDGAEHDLDPDDLVIADADGPVGFAGVMGGARTEVSAGTANLLVEVASFAPDAVLRGARRHRLHTEASTRFEKTVPAETVPFGAARCAALITRLAGGRLTAMVDAYPAPEPRPVIRLRTGRARSLLGMDLDDRRQRELLERIDCSVAAGDSGTGGELAVSPPPYRPDLRIEADLAEELARLEGYDRVPERVPATGAAGGRTPEHDAVTAVRRALAGAGWTEVLAFPFIADDDLDALGLPAGDRRRRPVALLNPLSKTESVLRTSLLPGLLRVLRHNVNRQVADLAVFEVGVVFWHPDGGEPGADGGPSGTVLPAEPRMLGFAACGAFEAVRYDRPARPADLFDLLGAAYLVRAAVGRARLATAATDEAPYHPGRAARVLVDGEDVGVVGELHPAVVEAYELPPRSLAGELRLDRIVTGGIRVPTAVAPSPLPGLRFDVAVVVDEAVPAAAVEAAVRAGAGPGLTSSVLFDVFRGPQLGEGRKSLAYALRVDDPARQLNDDDEQRLIAAVESAVAERLGGHLRR